MATPKGVSKHIPRAAFADSVGDGGTVARPMKYADTPVGTAHEASLTDRANALCNTLAGCEELLEAIVSRISGSPPIAGAGMPMGNTLLSAIEVANMRADTLLTNLRELAATVGT